MVSAVPPAPRVLTLLIDNYDSYTYNVFQMLAEINGVEPMVVRNDAFQGKWEGLWQAFMQHASRVKEKLNERFQSAREALERPLYLNIVLSPGPGHPSVPQDFGLCAQAIHAAKDLGIPVLGICLGHQGLVTEYGGQVVHAPEVMHGRTSLVRVQTRCSGSDIFAHIPDEFNVVRYHSLVAQDPLPSDFEVLARTDDGSIMALRHRLALQFGVQFHPEAVCSEYGYQLLQNFRDLTAKVEPSTCLLHHGGRQHAFRALWNDKASNDTSRQKRPAPYRVYVSCLFEECASVAFSAFVFEKLYGRKGPVFWLDSSNHDLLQNSAPNGVVALSNARFSLMGDARGPLSHIVEYSEVAQQLRVRRNTGDCRYEVIDHSCVLNYLRDQLSQFADHELVINGSDGQETLPFSFRGGFVGYLGYEVLGSELHNNDDASSTKIKQILQKRWDEGTAVPDASLIFADRTLVFDHESQRVYSVRVDSGTGDSRPSTSSWEEEMTSSLKQLHCSFIAPDNSTSVSRCAEECVAEVVFHSPSSREQYISEVKAAQDYIQDGETYEVCLTNQLEADVRISNPLDLYKILRRRNPAPYAAYYSSASRNTVSNPTANRMLENYAICCSSPERFLRIGQDRWMESKPIKGTRPRGRSASEDLSIAKELASSVKDRAENMMIADLVRNDFGIVSEIGSVHVPKLMHVESYATVHQLVTTVRGRRHSRADVIDVLCATFPGGSMTGAPKKRTMQIIRKLEQYPRGVYSGALGFLSISGSCDLNIIIRTAVVTPHSVAIGAGGAIVALSDADEEYDEMRLKCRALVEAIGVHVTGEPSRAAVATHSADDCNCKHD